ncbi:hypothetical protein E2C01_046461 [Portunus trituberculatus]|uniref:Uncharacterized protein n=1 Tax=Portunus trituberculatus TaxID=210409 RepID=A0A5B7FXY9_PORTR|nr:hypothetical protein [Portunus trituberculatus]
MKNSRGSFTSPSSWYFTSSSVVCVRHSKTPIPHTELQVNAGHKATRPGPAILLPVGGRGHFNVYLLLGQKGQCVIQQ